MAELKAEAVMDCEDSGCEECRVCRYLGFLEHAQSVGGCGPGLEVRIERDAEVEAYLDDNYPCWRQ